MVAKGRLFHASRWGLSALVWFVLSSSSLALAETPPTELLAKILFKMATYDGNLPSGDVRVAVVYPSSDSNVGPDAVRALKVHDGMLVNGRRIVSFAAPYARVGELARVLGAEPLYALFVAASTPDKDIPTIRSFAAQRGSMTFAQAPDQVGLGLTAGVRQDAARREILLNVHVAMEQQRRFDGAFVSACTIVRKGG